MSQFFSVAIANTAKNESEKFWGAVWILLASCFIGLCAQIEIPLYFTPVPLTGQTFGVMLVGAFLGKKKGALAAFTYLVQGALGYPIFAGGSFGFHHLIGPTGGYLLFYPIEAYLFGWSVQCLSYQFLKGSAICSLHLAIGSLWLCLFVGVKDAFVMGFYPFIFVEIAKAFSVHYLYLKKWR